MKVKDLVEILQRMDEDEAIAYDLWQVEDVQAQALNDGVDITPPQAEAVLLLVQHTQDANYGITWETISAAIRTIKE